MFYQLKKTFAGHVKVLGGPHVARGPDVAQACSIRTRGPSKMRFYFTIISMGLAWTHNSPYKEVDLRSPYNETAVYLDISNFLSMQEGS